MARLVWYECKKILARRRIWVFLLVCLVVNAAWAGHRLSAENLLGYSQADVARAYGEFSEPPTTDALYDRVASFQADLLGGTISADIREYLILSEIYARGGELEGYADYLDSVRDQAELRLSSPFFAQPGSYSYRNLLRTEAAYAVLDGVMPEADYDGGILCVTENTVTDGIVTVLLLLFVLQVFAAEWEDGTATLLNTMRRGRGALVAAKAAMVLLLSLVLVLAFYLSDMLVAARLVGFGDTGRVIQSVEGYFTSAIAINVRQYLAAFLLARVAVLFCAGCVFAACCTLAKASVPSLLLGLLLFGAEYALYALLASNSWLAPFRDFNLAALLDTRSYFAEYANCNFFSYAVPRSVCGVITCVLGVAAGILLALLFQQAGQHGAGRLAGRHAHKVQARAAKRTERHRQRRYRPRSLLYYEAYKLLVVNRGVAVLVVCVCLQFLLACSIGYYTDAEEFYYREYSQTLEGGLSEEKEQFLLDEEAFFQEREDELNELYAQYDAGEINDTQLLYYENRLTVPSDRISAFSRAEEQYGELQEMASEGRDADYVYLTPWESLFRSDMPSKEFLILMEAFLFMMLLLCGSGAAEKSTGVNQLIAVSVAGSRGVLGRKATLALASGLLVGIVVFLPDLWGVALAYGLGGWGLSAAGFLSETALAALPFSMGGYFLFRQALRLVTVILMSLLMLLISERAGNRIISLLAGAILFLLPLFLCLMGSI